MARKKRVFHLLLVDDDPAFARLMSLACSACRTPRRLTHCLDGAQGLDLLHKRGPFTRASRPDLVLLDINLPGISGLDLLEQIKATPDLREIPVAIVSSSSHGADVAKAYSAGAACYITKPTDFDELERVVNGSARFWLETAELPSTKPAKRAAGA